MNKLFQGLKPHLRTSTNQKQTKPYKNSKNAVPSVGVEKRLKIFTLNAKALDVNKFAVNELRAST